MSEQEIQLVMGVITLVCTGLLFPFVFYFFKKNERLHEETKSKIGTHDTTLALHNVRLVSLEEWRAYQMNGIIPTVQHASQQSPQTSPVTINN
jgi:hypothetical protein